MSLLGVVGFLLFLERDLEVEGAGEGQRERRKNLKQGPYPAQSPESDAGLDLTT